jgi:hypothetical protein
LIAGTGCVISADDIVVYSLMPAEAGTAARIEGVNGLFSFRVSPYVETWRATSLNSAYADGTITATPYDPTANEPVETLRATSLKAYVQDGTLHVTGLTPGASWKVYTMTGVLIYQSTATGAETKTSLPTRGLYIVTDGKTTLKVVN